MPVLLPAHLDVFYGAVDPAAAHVYVRWSASDEVDLRALSLGGTIRGPFNHLARTLPATVRLVDQGPGESLLARAIVPDPCYWVPGAPYLYNVRVEARDGGRVIAEAQRTLGIRALGAAGRRFRLAGKGWLPRAIHRDLVKGPNADDLAAWRELGAVMIARSPGDNLCRQASEQGVLIFAEGPRQNPTSEMRRLKQWPAVGMIFCGGEASFREDRDLARNLLVARWFTSQDPSPQTSPNVLLSARCQRRRPARTCGAIGRADPCNTAARAEAVAGRGASRLRRATGRVRWPDRDGRSGPPAGSIPIVTAPVILSAAKDLTRHR